MTFVLAIVALGLLASLSPATIVVFILVLATTRARVNAAAFLIGWGVSLIVVFCASYAIGASHQTQQGSGYTAVRIIEILLGVALLFAAGRQWRTRHRPRTSSGVPPALEARLKRLSPWEAVIVGILKEPWTLTAAAAVVVVSRHSALYIAVIALVLFLVISTATVGLTFLYFARRPGEAQQHLHALRDRLVRAGPVVAAVVALVVGLYLIGDGALGLVRS